MKQLKECKIKCNNWWWNRTLQQLLFKYGVQWALPGERSQTVWNCRRRGLYLFLTQNPTNGSWWFSWGTADDFERSHLPETTAKVMVREYALEG
jgi:hypothetical protein